MDTFDKDQMLDQVMQAFSNKGSETEAQTEAPNDSDDTASEMADFVMVMMDDMDKAFSGTDDRSKAILFLISTLIKSMDEDSIAEAIYILGTAYEQGKYNIKKDYKKALRAYGFMAQAGDVRALERMEVMFRTGDGVAQDDEMADTIKAIKIKQCGEPPEPQAENDVVVQGAALLSWGNSKVFCSVGEDGQPLDADAIEPLKNFMQKNGIGEDELIYAWMDCSMNGEGKGGGMALASGGIYARYWGPMMRCKYFSWAKMIKLGTISQKNMKIYAGEKDLFLFTLTYANGNTNRLDETDAELFCTAMNKIRLGIAKRLLLENK